jgi:hypothetical protein
LDEQITGIRPGHTLVSLESQIGKRAQWLYQAVAPPLTG